MAQGNFADATRALPRAFKEVYAQPKIREQVKAIGDAPVKAMIELQLARLASLMVTGGNLNDAMTDFISSELMDLYPTESIADIKLCLERGAMGRYGEIQRMDGVTIGLWMGKYLEEKYTEMEGLIQTRKANDLTKEPIEGLEQVYKTMKDETTKAYMVKVHAMNELNRRYAPADTDASKQRDEAYLRETGQI